MASPGRILSVGVAADLMDFALDIIGFSNHGPPLLEYR